MKEIDYQIMSQYYDASAMYNQTKFLAFDILNTKIRYEFLK